MIETFGKYNIQELKEKCLDLINNNKSFYVKCIRDDSDNTHHWEIEY